MTASKKSDSLSVYPVETLENMLSYAAPDSEKIDILAQLAKKLPKRERPRRLTQFANLFGEGNTQDSKKNIETITGILEAHGLKLKLVPGTTKPWVRPKFTVVAANPQKQAAKR